MHFGPSLPPRRPTGFDISNHPVGVAPIRKRIVPFILIPTERHPACRRREARSGSGTERENLADDAKGKGASGSHREAESTDASERGGLPRISDEGPVMGLERRRWVIAADVGQLVRREEPFVQWEAAASVRWHEPDDARVSCPDL